MAQTDTVLVTGGSGYIGGWCVARLLDDGFHVRTTIRDLSREAELRRSLGSVAPQAAERGGRLTVVAADLEADGGWAEAARGCRYVLHVSSPLSSARPRDPNSLIRPARDGALRVLGAAVAGGVERVVMTSSVAAVGESGVDGVRDETSWTDADAPGVSNYARSKTLAEQAARDLMQAKGGRTSFATVNPALVLGPVTGADFSSSVQVVSRMLRGTMPGTPRIGFCIVDVRDVADLHVRAMTAPQAGGGRYIAAGDFLWLAEVAAILRRRLGERARKVPNRQLPDILVRIAAIFDADVRTVASHLGRRREFSAAKAERDLGWSPRPAEAVIVECAQSLIAHRLA